MTGKRYQSDFQGARIIDNTITTAELDAGVTQGLTNNPIINGGMNVWQRGTTFTSVANLAYTADRWKYGVSGAAVHDVLQSTDVPAVAALMPLTSYSLHLDVTTADPSIATNDISLIRQKIEGYLWAPFAQRQFTVGFWVKDTITGVHCVSALNSGSDRSCVMEYTVNVADTWEYKTVTFPASPSAGTWDYTTGVGLDLGFPQSCGPTLQTTAGSWQTGSFFGTSSIVNSTSSAANNFKLWGVTMGLGSTVAPFWPRSYGQELALCQRYYQKSYDYGTAPGTATLVGMTNAGVVNATGGTNPHGPVRFQPTMRTAPTVTVYDSAGTTGQFYNLNTGANAASASASQISTSGCWITNAGTATPAMAVHYVASAEL